MTRTFLPVVVISLALSPLALTSLAQVREVKDEAIADDAKAAVKAGDDDPKPSASGINDAFIALDLDVEKFLERFEVESREVYAARKKILAACEIQAGMDVADVGAGTGFYSRLFSQAVGPTGWIFAVELSPRFLDHITKEMQANAIVNMTAVRCRENSVDLPPNSIDMAFICDTYHHFEFPSETMRSLHRALRKNGTLVVIDFEKIPGKSREWIIGHVRADKKTVQDEIQSVGFGLVEEITIPEFKENYFLRFRKR